MSTCDFAILSALLGGFIWGRFVCIPPRYRLRRLAYRWNAVSNGWSVGSPYRQLGTDYRLGMSDCASELLKELGEKT